MIPIYEQGDGHGIGHGLESFLDRFDEICKEHLAKNQAKSFAFIFYDFEDKVFRNILRDQGVFAQLDRLSKTKLSIFYLHSGKRDAIEEFNSHFLRALGIGRARLPCVVFFRVRKGNIQDVEIIQLESADDMHGFHELYTAIDQYIKGQSTAYLYRCHLTSLFL